MPSFRDIVYGIYGAWRLARLDRGAMTYFECTVGGFWKSFFAAVIVAPGYMIIIAAEPSQIETDAGVVRVFLVHLCAYVIGWTAFPVAAHHICEAIGKRDEFIGYIVAFNWAKVIQIAIYLPMIALFTSGLLPEDLVLKLHWAILSVILGYEWFITHTALGVRPMAAAGFVVMDFVIDVFIQLVTLGMLR